jgi:hypothetical protein
MNKIPDLDIKSILKERLLDAYEANPSLVEEIESLTRLNSNFRSGNRGECFKPTFLIGLLIGLYPEFANFINLLFQLNSDPEKMLTILELNFNPTEELQKRQEERLTQIQQVALIEEEKSIIIESDEQNKSEIDPEYETASKYLDEIREQIKQENSS